MISNFTGKRKHEEREERKERGRIRESDKGKSVGRLKVERETKMY